MKIVLDVKEVSELLGVSTDSIYALVRESKIPHIRIRRRILFHKESLEAWMKGGFTLGG
jgi:excisionase family DNA binding protein